MSFIERVREMDTARRVLGVKPCATPVEIRAAWKQAVFATHPDRSGGSHEGFDHVREAYDILRNEALTSHSWEHDADDVADKPRDEVSIVRRPGSIKSRFEQLTERTVSDCTDALDQCDAGDGDCREPDIDLGYGFAFDPNEGVTDHIPRMVERRGRSITFIVSTPVANGSNRLALPTALLKDKRRPVPKVLRFLADNLRGDSLEVPSEVVAREFPGAKKVEVRFERR